MAQAKSVAFKIATPRLKMQTEVGGAWFVFDFELSKGTPQICRDMWVVWQRDYDANGKIWNVTPCFTFRLDNKEGALEKMFLEFKKCELA